MVKNIATLWQATTSGLMPTGTVARERMLERGKTVSSKYRARVNGSGTGYLQRAAEAAGSFPESGFQMLQR